MEQSSLNSSLCRREYCVQAQVLLTNLTQARCPHWVITWISAALSNPLGESNLKLGRGIQGVMAERTDWGKAKLLGPSCPWDGRNRVAWIHTAASQESPRWWWLSGSKDGQVANLGQADPEATLGLKGLALG